MDLTGKIGLANKKAAEYLRPIVLDNGFEFDQWRTIRLISLYSLGKFESGEFDEKGRKKYFYQVLKKAADNATKMVDLDVSDIRFRTDIPEYEKMSWLASLEFKLWAKEIGLGKLLNDIAYNYPLFGSVVVKESVDGFAVVPLFNLIFDQAVNRLDESLFVIERHVMTRFDIEKMVWKNKKSLPNGEKFYVFEIYEKTAKGYNRFFLGKKYNSKISIRNLLSNCEILHQDKVDKLPYRELHWEKIPGRWLGFGVGEYMLEPQISENELENMERRGLYITSLHLFKSNDPDIGGNLYNEFEDGDIIKTQRDINMLEVSERNLAAFSVARNRWQQLIASNTFLFDLNTSFVNANTSASLAALLTQIQQSYFQLKKENFAFFVKDLIKEKLLEKFKQAKAKPHKLYITKYYKGADSFLESVAEVIFNYNIYKRIQRGNYFPLNYEEAKKKYVEKMRREGLSVSVPSYYYDKLDQVLDIDIVGEAYNNTQAVQGLQMLIQMLSTQPAVVQNKSLWTALKAMLESIGVPLDILMRIEDSAAEEQEQQNVAEQLRPGSPISLPEKKNELINQFVQKV